MTSDVPIVRYDEILFEVVPRLDTPSIQPGFLLLGRCRF